MWFLRNRPGQNVGKMYDKIRTAELSSKSMLCDDAAWRGRKGREALGCSQIRLMDAMVESMWADGSVEDSLLCPESNPDADRQPRMSHEVVPSAVAAAEEGKSASVARNLAGDSLSLRHGWRGRSARL